jgi:DNA-binding response OmpR family regulator
MHERILIVEDDPNIRDVCRRYLERDGYEVLLAGDGNEGWKRFCETRL